MIFNNTYLLILANIMKGRINFVEVLYGSGTVTETVANPGSDTESDVNEEVPKEKELEVNPMEFDNVLEPNFQQSRSQNLIGEKLEPQMKECEQSTLLSKIEDEANSNHKVH